MIYAETEWEHGLRCTRCPHLFVEGEEIYTSPNSVFEDGTPIVDVVCEACLADAQPSGQKSHS